MLEKDEAIKNISKLVKPQEMYFDEGVTFTYALC